MIKVQGSAIQSRMGESTDVGNVFLFTKTLDYFCGSTWMISKWPEEHNISGRCGKVHRKKLALKIQRQFFIRFVWDALTERSKILTCKQVQSKTWLFRSLRTAENADENDQTWKQSNPNRRRSKDDMQGHAVKKVARFSELVQRSGKSNTANVCAVC